jgi:tetratricopeptide (TPR) repeat protein
LPQVSHWEAAPIAFQPGGRLLAVGKSFQETRLIDRETGATVADLMHSPTETSHLFGLSFSPDGTRLAVTRGFDDVCVWDLARLNAELTALKLGLTELPSPRTDQPVESDSLTLEVNRGNNLLPPTDWYKFWVRLAYGEIYEQHWPDAIDDLNRALQQAIIPTGNARAEVLRLRAKCHVNHNDFVAARTDLREALAIDRQHAVTIRQLARLYLLGPPELRDANQAMGLLSGLPADSPDVTVLLGAAHLRLGQHTQAISLLEKVSDRPDSQSLVSLLLSVANWHAGNRETAKRSWESVRESLQKSAPIETDIRLLQQEVSTLFDTP